MKQQKQQKWFLVFRDAAFIGFTLSTFSEESGQWQFGEKIQFGPEDYLSDPKHSEFIGYSSPLKTVVPKEYKPHPDEESRLHSHPDYSGPTLNTNGKVDGYEAATQNSVYQLYPEN